MLRDAASHLQTAIADNDAAPGVLFAYRANLEMQLIKWRTIIGLVVIVAVIALAVGGFMLHATAKAGNS